MVEVSLEDFEDFLHKHIRDFKVLCERAPTLWRYNIAGYVVANIFGDQDDVIKPNPIEIEIEQDPELDFAFEPQITDFFEDEIVIEK